MVATAPRPGALAGIRIVIVHATLEFAGAERQSLNLARYLRKVESAEVEFWGFTQPGALARKCEAEGFRWRLVPGDWSPGRLSRLRTVLRFARTLRRARPDVLLPYTPLPNVLCSLTWRFAGVRFCIWSHRAAHPFLRGSRLEALALRMAPCVVSNSEHAAQELAALHRLPSARIRIIPNGVEIERAVEGRASWRAKLRVPDDAIVVVMVAVVRSDKDHETVLRAWRRILDRHTSGPTPVLLLAGHLGDSELRVKALAFDLQLGNNVRILGHAEDLSGLLAASDLGVFATIHEGLPNGVLECMAAGLMVVACDHPAIREALGAVQSEWIVPARDPEALASRLLDAFRDPEARRRIGERNRESIAHRFPNMAMCSRTAVLIQNALGLGAHGGDPSDATVFLGSNPEC